MQAYILRLVCAALISGTVLSLVTGERSRKAVKLLCGIFLTLTLLHPLSRLELGDCLLFDSGLGGEAYIQAGEKMAREAMASFIKAETEAYIQDKAMELGLQVEVILGQDPPVPVAAVVHGSPSPAEKARLEWILQEDLGIPKERVSWTG